jgi:murein DD-endopeptidase MepM/ murein hydrolase activator NlpD
MVRLFRSFAVVTFLLRNSRYRISLSDNFIVGMKSYLKLVFFLGFVAELSANPFQRFNDEIEKSLSPSTSSVFKIFGNQESEMQKLFEQGVNTQTEEEDAQVASLDFPKYLDISPVVSNTVVHESGVILKKYTVVKKDTLTKIAKTFLVDAAKIKKQNALTSTHLKLGQILEIPVQIKNASASRVIRKKVFVLPVPQSRITSRFGRRIDPFNKYNRVYHTGLDLAAKVGTPVVSSADGEVIFTGRNGGYGNSVIIQHKNGYKTVYAHCSQILVEVGETVKMGRVIAAVGRTGTATGAHLHFEVFLNGKLMNPESALNITEKFVTKLPKSEIAGI